MENYTRIIESLTVSFSRAHNIQLEQPIGIEGFYELANTLIYVRSGTLYYGTENEPVREGEILFIPSGKRNNLNFGATEPKNIIAGGFQGEQKDFLHENQAELSAYNTRNTYSFIIAGSQVFNAVNLFSSLDIPPFVIRDSRLISNHIDAILLESKENSIGKDTLLDCQLKVLTTYIMRYILDNKLFVQQIITNTNNLRDERLISLLKYVNENLSQDLSNKQLSSIVNVSEDYVGQYFKTLTGINPQDYIEFQRMQLAVRLLRGSNKSIAHIGKEVGYKDSSYFCRRFKMMFGISAGRMRRREKTTQAETLKSTILAT